MPADIVSGLITAGLLALSGCLIMQCICSSEDTSKEYYILTRAQIEGLKNRFNAFQPRMQDPPEYTPEYTPEPPKAIITTPLIQ